MPTVLPPTIVDYQREVQCSEGEQVTLTVKVAGSPHPHCHLALQWEEGEG